MAFFLRKRMNRLTLIIITLFAAAGFSRGQLAPEENRFIQALINEYQVLDIARQYCEKKLESATSDLARASYRWFLEADIPRITGDLERSQKANSELAKAFPKHPRAARARFDNVKIEMDRLTDTWDAAMLEADMKKRGVLLDKMVSDFEKIIKPGFKELIKDLRELYKSTPRPKPGEAASEEYNRILELRNETEYFWILALMRFADFARQPGLEGKRKAALDEAIDEAEYFVGNRPMLFVLRFLAQLQKGLAYKELGKFREAIGALDILKNVPIPSPPPWNAVLIEQIGLIHLQAYLNLIRCYNDNGKYQQAADLSDRLFGGQPPPVNLVALQKTNTSMQPYWVEAQMEGGIALAGVGRPSEGAAKIRGIIATYALKQDSDFQARLFVNKARMALGRMVLVAGPIFSPDTILEAGKGFKDRKNWADAMNIFQTGLGVECDAPARINFFPRFLKEMAECAYFAGDAHGMLFANLTGLRHFAKDCEGNPELEAIRQNLANNALTSAREVQKTESNRAIDALEKEAEHFFELYGDPAVQETKKLVDGGQLKSDGKYQQARDMYLTVNTTYTDKGKTKKFNRYWESRAEAAECLYQAYKEEEDDKKDAQKLVTVEKELTDTLAKATAEKESSGLAAASLYLGKFYTEQSQFKKAWDILVVFDNELSDDRDFRDVAMRIQCQLLWYQDERVKGLRKLIALEKAFPKSPEWANAAFYGFFHYNAREDFVAAAYYAEKYLSHPFVKQAKTPDDLLFDFGLAFAESEKPKFLVLAKQIFEPLWEGRDKLKLAKQVGIARGLISIYKGEKKYADAIKLGREILEKNTDENASWVVDLKRDLAKIFLYHAVILSKQGKASGDTKLVNEAAKFLLDAEEFMNSVVARLKAAVASNPGNKELRIILFDDYYWLLRIKATLGRKQEVLKELERFFKKKYDLPEALINKYKALQKLLLKSSPRTR